MIRRATSAPSAPSASYSGHRSARPAPDISSCLPILATLGLLAFAGPSTLLAAQAPETAGAGAVAVEGTSLLGRPLVRPSLPEATVAEHEAALAALDARLVAHPDDAAALVWRGRHLGYLGRYREAIDVFDQGVERFPEDPRFFRHRGHRKISLRDLAGAVADLEAGLALAAGRPDRVEPDGLPNLYNRPTGTSKTNLWYHLGLARYLQGDFVRAAEAFTSCAALADNPDMLVAASYWRYLAVVRSGRTDDAGAALAAAPLEAALLENHDYQDLLRLFAAGPGADRLADELLARHAPGSVGAVTLSYGVGAWHHLSDRTDAARALWRRLVDGDGWAGFGFVAAETELARSQETRSTHR